MIRANVFYRYFKPPAPTVQVFVGPNRELWILPEDLLCDMLKYFREAFKGNFKEGMEKQIHLVDEEPGTFALLIDWIMDSFYSIEDCSPSGAIPTDCPLPLAGFKLYVLADKIGGRELMHHALEILFPCHLHRDSNIFTIHLNTVKFIYDHEAQLSELRQYCVDEAVQFFFTDNELEESDWLLAVKGHPSYDLEVTKAIKNHIQLPMSECGLAGLCSTHYPREEA